MIDDPRNPDYESETITVECEVEFTGTGYIDLEIDVPKGFDTRDKDAVEELLKDEYFSINDVEDIDTDEIEIVDFEVQ